MKNTLTFGVLKYKLCLLLSDSGENLLLSKVGQNSRFERLVAKRKSLGWLAERSNATVLKTADGATRPGVRIPHHPPLKLNTPKWVFYFYRDCDLGLGTATKLPGFDNE